MFMRFFSSGSNMLFLTRLFTMGFIALLTGCQSTATNSSASTSPETLLIGGYTKEAGEGIYKLSFDGKSLTNQGLVVKETNPSYLAINNNKSKVFAAIGDKSGGIAQFNWDEASNTLVLADRITGLGKGTCHVALSNNGQQAAIANYGSGEIFLFDTHSEEASIGLTLVGSFKNQGSSITQRQKSPHMHFVHWDNSGKFLYAVDLGTDEILVIDTEQHKTKTKSLPTGKTHEILTPQVATKLTPGDGPRHLVFHPTKPLVYVLNELSNTVTSYTQNQQDGSLSVIHRIDALQTKTTLKNKASAIKISNDGKFVYAAVRGVNQISVFEVTENGTLNFIQRHSTLGDWPRDIALSAQQDFLFIANRRANAINVLKRDTTTGLLSSTSLSATVSTPSYIGLF